MRNLSSTIIMLAGETTPHKSESLSMLRERISSHLMKLRCVSPPSGGLTSTWKGIPLSFDVIGRTIANPDTAQSLYQV